MKPSYFSSAQSEFREAVSISDEEIDLARAAILITRIEDPDFEVEAFLESLNALAAQVVLRGGGHPDPLVRVRALIDVVIKDLGLQGATTNYYDPRNAFLNEVLERKVGVPIALSIILMSVASRWGARRCRCTSWCACWGSSRRPSSTPTAAGGC